MPKKKTLTEQEVHALIEKDARYRRGCEDFVPTFALRRAEPDTSGRFPRANWDVTPEGAEEWPPAPYPDFQRNERCMASPVQCDELG